MTAVMVEMTTTRTKSDDDEIRFVDDMEDFGADALPGCSDDNPYR
ncbi:hypothetical protein [Streptomyces sp. NRRL WC-3742]|nr:hypothetical protein [Streptomyces sp. NRRL WC-3742]